jgi:SNF2 family DNA or RNA helicase
MIIFVILKSKITHRNLMNTSFIKYYTSKSTLEQELIEIIALKAIDIDFINIYRIAKKLNIKITQALIKDTIKELVKLRIIEEYSSMWDRKQINKEFLIYILPSSGHLKYFYEEEILSSEKYYYYPVLLKDFRDLLYALLFYSKNDFTKKEGSFIANYSSYIPQLYELIINDLQYRPYLYKMSRTGLQPAIRLKKNNFLLEMESPDLINEYLNDLYKYLPPDVEHLNMEDVGILYSGQWDKFMESLSDEIQIIYIQAIKELISGNANESFELFQKGLNKERQINKSTYIPMGSEINITFYYICSLLNVENEKSFPIFKNLIQAAQKNKNSSILIFFLPLLYSILDIEPHTADLNNNYIINIENIQLPIYSLFSILAYFISAQKLPGFLKANIQALLEKAYSSGYYIIAFEVAFAFKKAYDDSSVDKMINDMEKKLSYKPVLSSIRQVADWEKSLNLLLGFRSKAKKSPKNEKSSRVVYYFSPKSGQIQPVQQTSNKNGWSAGRNISLKKFAEGNVEEMTEQDLRIAKTLKFYSNYYNKYYDFPPSVFRELIGHPYIFLNGTNDIPVEFTSANPVIQAIKNRNVYTITSDIKAGESPVFIKKQTNTRYYVYELSRQQEEILKIIDSKNLTIPESGKEKLMQVLSELASMKMDVQSDLLADKTEKVSIKEVVADNRIRVQLIPFGNGLKAEFFIKPFSDLPPYVKPGIGGKVLFQSNENGERLQVKRNLKEETKNENELLNDIQTVEDLEINDSLMTFDTPEDALFLLEILDKHKEKLVIEWPEGGQMKLKASASLDSLYIRIKSSINWFEIQGDLKIDENTVITLQELMELVKKSPNRFIELSSGEFIALSKDLKKRLEELNGFSTNDKKVTKLNKFSAVALNGFFDNLKHIKSDKSWKDFKSQIEKSNTGTIEIPSTMQAELRPYQEEGFRWMSRLASWKAGACLSDDMGLGKTIQTLTILLQRCQQGAALVICPVSVIGNWINEAMRFAPSLQVKTLGNANREETLNTLRPNDLLVTSYGLLQSEEKLFAAGNFATIVLDEAHTIKNYATKTSKAAMQLKGDFRIALTGTPVQNHSGEIWNIFNFTNPGLLGSLQQFNDRFIKNDDEASRKRLKKLISPFILRRTKAKVLDELPPKTEIIKKVSLSNEEMAFYEALRRQALENISSDNSNAGTKHLRILAEITKLRQAACNPLLIDKEIKIPSSKLEVLLSTINELIENNHRALIFSQFVSHLYIVRKELDKLNIPYQYLDGSSTLKEREASVEAFQSGKGEVFLISLKAGGLGLNLTAADFVIHLDPWWNPAIEDQASDRTHRIGQTRSVTIYRLVAENTIEEKIIQLHNTKRKLAESLLAGTDSSAKLSAEELVNLIKNESNDEL